MNKLESRNDGSRKGIAFLVVMGKQDGNCDGLMVCSKKAGTRL